MTEAEAQRLRTENMSLRQEIQVLKEFIRNWIKRQQTERLADEIRKIDAKLMRMQ